MERAGKERREGWVASGEQRTFVVKIELFSLPLFKSHRIFFQVENVQSPSIAITTPQKPQAIACPPLLRPTPPPPKNQYDVFYLSINGILSASDNKLMNQQRRKHELLSDPELLVRELKLRERIPEEEMVYLLNRVSLLMKNQPNLLRLASPIHVVGDIHGQFYDLLNIFHLYNAPPRQQYLFLGDFIDRGTYSIEVITLLLAYKLKFPQSIHLLRGNHESRCMTTNFNFREECLTKYGEEVYELVMKLFDQLPICAIIDQKYFAVHAGISPTCQTIEEIQRLNRFEEIPESGGLCDLVWSDPSDELTNKWEENENRRCSYYFGVNQAKAFLNRNNLKMIIRGHQVELQGYKYQKFMNLPLTLTIFSAPNYSNHNKASIAQIANGQLEIKVFSEVEHPVTLPNFMHVFEWSFPFISICTEHIFRNMIKLKANTDRKLKEIMQSKEAFNQDYERMRTAILVDRILQIKQKPEEERKIEEEVYHRLPRSSSKENLIERRARPKVESAKVIGPKLQQKLHKIGHIQAQDEKQVFDV